MRERYLCMVQLQEQLAQLYDLCGVKADMVKVSPMPAPLQWLEKLIQDNQLYNYLENLNELTGQAIKEMKNRKFDDWNNEQNELLIDDLYGQLEKQGKQLEMSLEKQLKLEGEKKELQAAASRQDREQLETIRAIITMRDNLLMKESWIRDCMPQEVNAAKVVKGQLQETAKLLEQMGVEIMEDTGAFNSHCHTVVETKPAPTPDLVDTIAETFRPGYRFRGEALRAQEVIVYVSAQEEM